MAAVTRLGLYGGTRGLYGSFAGKEEGAPVVEGTPGGGWAMLGFYDRYYEEHLQREEERRKAQEKIKRIEDETDAEIARLLHKKLDYEDRTEEIKALEAMVKTGYTARQLQRAREYNEVVSKAYAKAAKVGTFAAVEAFEREMELAREEEEFLLLALVSLD